MKPIKPIAWRRRAEPKHQDRFIPSLKQMVPVYWPLDESTPPVTPELERIATDVAVIRQLLESQSPLGRMDLSQ